MRRIKTEIDGRQRRETANRQPRADEQHEREGHFDDHQSRARAASGACRSASGIHPPRHGVTRGHAQHRRHEPDDKDDDRDDRGEREHAR
jgi:hypothetical protein